LGDNILQNVSKTVKDHLRSSDVVGRFSEDEFAIMLPFTAGESGLQAAKNLCGVIAESFICEELAHVSICVGVCSYKEGDNIFSLIKRADVALLEAKKRGKNKAVFKH